MPEPQKFMAKVWNPWDYILHHTTTILYCYTITIYTITMLLLQYTLTMRFLYSYVQDKFTYKTSLHRDITVLVYPSRPAIPPHPDGTAEAAADLPFHLKNSGDLISRQ